METLELDVSALSAIIDYYVSLIQKFDENLPILDMQILDIYVAQSDMSCDPSPPCDLYHPSESYGSAEWVENEIFEGRHRIV